MLDAVKMLEALKGVAAGSAISVSYVAGRQPTDRAVREAERHVTNPTRSRHRYVGSFVGTRVTRRGDIIMTIFADNRDTERNGSLRPGGYRTFNPNLGTLLSVEVLDEAE